LFFAKLIYVGSTEANSINKLLQWQGAAAEYQKHSAPAPASNRALASIPCKARAHAGQGEGKRRRRQDWMEEMQEM
jgi:hypothetical protein